MQHRLRHRLLASAVVVAIAVGWIAAARADGPAGDRPPRLLVIITGESNSGGPGCARRSAVIRRS